MRGILFIGLVIVSLIRKLPNVNKFIYNNYTAKYHWHFGRIRDENGRVILTRQCEKDCPEQ
mgnify:CR=1 FL=1